MELKKKKKKKKKELLDLDLKRVHITPVTDMRVRRSLISSNMKLLEERWNKIEL